MIYARSRGLCGGRSPEDATQLIAWTTGQHIGEETVRLRFKHTVFTSPHWRDTMGSTRRRRRESILQLECNTASPQRNSDLSERLGVRLRLPKNAPSGTCFVHRAPVPLPLGRTSSDPLKAHAQEIKCGEDN